MPEHTALPSLYPGDRVRLRAFREAVADLYRHLSPYVGRELKIGGERRLIPEAALRAAAPGLRLVMLEGERAHLAGVLEALPLLKDPEVQRSLDEFTGGWATALKGQIHFVVGEDAPFDSKRVLDAWLYGRTFHHDSWRAQDLARLNELGDLATLALQVVIISLARLLLSLDAVVASVLGEPWGVDHISLGDERFF